MDEADNRVALWVGSRGKDPVPLVCGRANELTSQKLSAKEELLVPSLPSGLSGLCRGRHDRG